MEIPVKKSNKKVQTIKAILNHIDKVIPEHRVSNPNYIVTIKFSAKKKAGTCIPNPKFPKAAILIFRDLKKVIIDTQEKMEKNLKIENKLKEFDNTKKELVTRIEKQIRYGHDKLLEHVPSARSSRVEELQ